MIRRFVLCTAIFCLALAIPSLLAAEHLESHWYQPNYLPSTQDAASRLERLSRQFSPVTIQGEKFFLESGYSFQNGDADKLGIHMVFKKGHAAKGFQGKWSWAGGSNASGFTPGKDDIVSTLVYAEIGYFQIWKVPDGYSTPKWCVVPIDRQARHNDILCVTHEEDADMLVDALATLVRADGRGLTPPFGMWAKPGSQTDYHRKLEQSGWSISAVDVEGPVADSGLRIGDIVYKVNGKPCPGSGTFFGAFSEAAQKALDGGNVRLDVLRNGVAMFVVLHYPPSDSNPEQMSLR